MKLIILSLFFIFFVGCATTLKPLEDKKGAVYIKQYEAPIENVFKVAKSIAYRSSCATMYTIYDDELRYELYSIFRTYGMIPEYVWLIRIKQLSDNSTEVELSWSPYVLTEGCFTKNFFEEVGSFLHERSPRP